MRYTEQLVCSLNYNGKIVWECWDILTNRKAVIILFCAFLFGWYVPRSIWTQVVKYNMAMYQQYASYPNPMEGIFIPPAWHWILHTIMTSPRYEIIAYAITGALVIALLKGYLSPQGLR